MPPNPLLIKICAGAAVLVILVVSAVAWWTHQASKQQQTGYQKCEAAVSVPKEVADLQDKLDQANITIKALQAQETEKHELQEIPARRITRPVWVCAADALPQPAAGVQTSTDGGAVPGPGPTVAGPGTDIRPGIEAFKARYEAMIAHARAALAQCPNVTLEPLQ